MDPWDNHLLGGVECRKEIWYITKVQMVLLRIEERLIWTFSVILPMAAFADAIILKNHPICRQGSSNFFLIGLSFSDRGQAWRLPSEHRVFLFKAPRWGTWTATRMALPLMSLICRFHGSRRSPYRPCHRLTLMWWPPDRSPFKWWSPNRSPLTWWPPHRSPLLSLLLSLGCSTGRLSSTDGCPSSQY